MALFLFKKREFQEKGFEVIFSRVFFLNKKPIFLTDGEKAASITFQG